MASTASSVVTDAIAVAIRRTMIVTGSDVGALKLRSESDGDSRPLATNCKCVSPDVSGHTKCSGSGRGGEPQTLGPDVRLRVSDNVELELALPSGVDGGESGKDEDWSIHLVGPASSGSSNGVSAPLFGRAFGDNGSSCIFLLRCSDGRASTVSNSDSLAEKRRWPIT